MCRICDGASLEEVLASDAARIDEHGYVMMGVEGDADGVVQPWVYTIGLLDLAVHPELIVVGAEIDTAAWLLRLVAEKVLDGARFRAGDTIALPPGNARLRDVHEVHYDNGTFNMWHELRAYGAFDAPELTALQMMLPRSLFCPEHRDSQPLLSDPRVCITGPRPNRAERRRRQREGGG